MRAMGARRESEQGSIRGVAYPIVHPEHWLVPWGYTRNVACVRNNVTRFLVLGTAVLIRFGQGGGATGDYDLQGLVRLSAVGYQAVK